MEKVVLGVEGMGCKKCVARVEKICLDNGAKKAKASLDDKNVTISYDKEIDLEKIKKDITEAGYEVK